MPCICISRRGSRSCTYTSKCQNSCDVQDRNALAMHTAACKTPRRDHVPTTHRAGPTCMHCAVPAMRCFVAHGMLVATNVHAESTKTAANSAHGVEQTNATPCLPYSKKAAPPAHLMLAVSSDEHAACAQVCKWRAIQPHKAQHTRHHNCAMRTATSHQQ